MSSNAAPLRCHWPHLVPFAATFFARLWRIFRPFWTSSCFDPARSVRPRQAKQAEHAKVMKTVIKVRALIAVTGAMLGLVVAARQAKADLERDAKSSQATTVVAG